jgi:Ran GTPase-activating protein (RanGAP) involved in mRNA processing and transport
MLEDNPYIVKLSVGNYNNESRNRLSEANFEHLGRFLNKNKLLIYLDLSGLGFTNHSLQSLCHGLSGNQTLKYLYLERNNIGPWGGPILFNIISFSGIRSINIGSNSLGDAGIKEFAKCLEGKSSNNLHKIDLSTNGIQGMGFLHLADHLSRNFILDVLILEGNMFGGSRLIPLKNFLPNSSIRTLSLRNCELEDDCMEFIKLGLKKNKEIVNLDLSKNYIYAKGLKTLSEGLFSHPKIKSLNLSNNRIGDKASDAFYTLLADNKTIERLNLDNNLASEATAKQIIKVLKTNKILNSINMKNNSLNMHELTKIEEAVDKRNRIMEKENENKMLREIKTLKQFKQRKEEYKNILKQKIVEEEVFKTDLTGFLENINSKKKTEMEIINELEAELSETINKIKNVNNVLFSVEEQQQEYSNKVYKRTNEQAKGN